MIELLAVIKLLLQIAKAVKDLIGPKGGPGNKGFPLKDIPLSLISKGINFSMITDPRTEKPPLQLHCKTRKGSECIDLGVYGSASEKGELHFWVGLLANSNDPKPGLYIFLFTKKWEPMVKGTGWENTYDGDEDAYCIPIEGFPEKSEQELSKLVAGILKSILDKIPAGI